MKLKTNMTVRHLKRGHTYEVEGRAKMQISAETILRALPKLPLTTAVEVAEALERMTFVHYLHEPDDTRWSRPETEFCDGRFVEVD